VSWGLIRPSAASDTERRNARRPHAALHGREVEVLDDDLAVGFRQHGGELVGCLLAQVHAPAVEGGELGFRCTVPS
jgi:hypothetical protein